MTPDDEILVRQLLACDDAFEDCCRQDANPSTLQPQIDFTAKSVSAIDLSALDLHSRIVLECCHTLLMTNLVPVSEKMLYNLMGRIFFSHKHVWYSHGKHTLSCQKHMVLVNAITNLCLQGTAVIEEKMSSTNDDIFKCCWVALNDFHVSAEISRNTHKFIMILLAYGYLPLIERISDSLFQIKSECTVVTRYKIQDTRYFIVLLCIQLYTYKTKYTRT